MSVFNTFAPKAEVNQLGYSEFITEVQNDRISSVTNDGLVIEGVRVDAAVANTGCKHVAPLRTFVRAT